MNRSRQFRPLALFPLEDRVVLSHVVHVGHPPAHPRPHAVKVVKPTTLSPENVTQGSVGNFHGLTMPQTVKAGDPVYAQITTKYAIPDMIQDVVLRKMKPADALTNFVKTAQEIYNKPENKPR